jgi:hypothetical protein
MALISHPLFYTVVALWLLTGGGNSACRLLFRITDMKVASAGTAGNSRPAGYIIGWLERLLVAIGILAQSWEILAAVIALKTVARFKELDDRLPAEYFLVGSLFSILWAMLITGAWIGYDRTIGSDLHSAASGLLHPTPSLPAVPTIPVDPTACAPWCPMPPLAMSLSYTPTAAPPDRA